MMLVLLWPLKVVGIRWAAERWLHWHDVRGEREYAIEEFEQCRWKVRKYGTPWHFVEVGFDDHSGYDGWLADEDRYDQ